MNQHPLLAENESKRLTFRLPMLICFALFTAWQVGMMYFSTQTLSVDGRVASPMSQDITTILVAAGYILSILAMIFLPRIIVWMERVTVGIALLSALALFAPLSPEVFALAFYIQFFCCCFMIGLETAIIVNLFTEKTAVIHATLAYSVAFAIPALLQNDFVAVPFGVFRLFAVLACALQLYFYCKLPGRAWPLYAKKMDNLVCPKGFFAGVYAMEGLTALMTFFGLAIAETVRHGVFAYQLSAAVCGLAVFFLWKYGGVAPIRCASVLIGITALGFVAAIASLYVPALSVPTCGMLGAGITALGIQPLYGAIMAKRYPSRFISAGFIALCFGGILIHTVLLEALRDNIIVMYTVYLVIALVLAVLFLMLMPYLLYSFRGRTFHDIIGIIAEETVPTTETVTAQTAAPIAVIMQAEPAAPEDESLHALRMIRLSSHALEPLTRREYQLVDCIMRGMVRAEIAEEMKIKPESISKYRTRIYNKFGIHSRQELFKLAETLDREWPGK
jgi:DNA-binding CsgD family transcriptional regulator